MKRNTAAILLCIVIAALSIRLVGLNWDKGHHLHPDERFLTMVTQAVRWPMSIQQYIDTDNSPANPNNVGFNFYVYGTLPVYLVKIVAQVLSRGDYVNLTLVGRAMSAVVDTFGVIIIFFISRRLHRSEKESLISSAVYAGMALPIQLSHFYATDPYLVLFLLISVYFALSVRTSIAAACLSGIFFALACSSKVSGIVLLPVLVFSFIIAYAKHVPKLALSAVLFAIFAIITLRFSQPYLFAGSALIPHQLNPKYLASIHELQSYNNPNGWFPPGVQWINITKGWFPFENAILWGLGLPLGFISLLAIVFCLIRIRKEPFLIIPIGAIATIFIYQSMQFAQPLRYFYPLYPFLAIIIGIFLSKITSKTPKAVYVGIFAILLVWPLAVASIYTRPHSRVAATDWATLHIPAGSTISCEVWDDCVPLNGTPTYQFIELALYDIETPEKWTKIKNSLNSLDYIVLSSNRLYGSISSAQHKYPETTQWYKDLFEGRLGFSKVAEFTSRPTIPFPGLKLCIDLATQKYGRISSVSCDTPGISFVDDFADESWTVYDHPKVTIFKNQQ